MTDYSKSINKSSLSTKGSVEESSNEESDPLESTNESYP